MLTQLDIKGGGQVGCLLCSRFSGLIALHVVGQCSGHQEVFQGRLYPGCGGGEGVVKLVQIVEYGTMVQSSALRTGGGEGAHQNNPCLPSAD